MPEALARTDHDFVLSDEPRRPRKRVQAADRRAAPFQAVPRRASARPASMPFALLRRHPLALLTGLAGSGLLAGFLFNALMLQGSPHPAPLFGAVQKPVQAAPAPMALPPSRPAEWSSADKTASDPGQKTERTASAIVPVPPTRDAIGDVLRTGAMPDGARVLSAQRALMKLGYPVKADGTFGPGTKQAIERFERERKLPVTGEFAGRTAKELLAAAAAVD